MPQDYQDIAQRKATKGTEMFWAPSPSQPMTGGVLGFLPLCVALVKLFPSVFHDLPWLLVPHLSSQ